MAKPDEKKADRSKFMRLFNRAIEECEIEPGRAFVAISRCLGLMNTTSNMLRASNSSGEEQSDDPEIKEAANTEIAVHYLAEARITNKAIENTGLKLVNLTDKYGMVTYTRLVFPSGFVVEVNHKTGKFVEME